MATIRQAGQTGFLTLMAAALFTVSGCSTTPTASTQNHDPLHGVLTPPSLPQPNSSPKTPGTPTSYPHSGQHSSQPNTPDLISTNNATLAGMSSTLGRPLAIDNQGRALPGGQLTSGTWARPDQPQNPGYNPNPRVEQVPDAVPTVAKNSPANWQSSWGSANPPAATPGAAPVAAAAPTLTETLTKQLQDRGVFNQKVESLPTGVHLTCYMSRPNGGPRILEATAVDFATAAQGILQQIDANR